MNFIPRIALLATLLCATAPLARACDAEVIKPGSEPLVINVPDHQDFRIRSFTQVGGSERAVVKVTLAGQAPTLYNSWTLVTGPTPTPPPGAPAPTPLPSNPAAKSLGDQLQVIGPAEIVVLPVAGATLSLVCERHPPGGEHVKSQSNTGNPSATPIPAPKLPAETPNSGKAEHTRPRLCLPYA